MFALWFLLDSVKNEVGGNAAIVTPKSYLTFQGYDLAGGIHDGAVGRDGPADGCVGVCQVDDHHLSLLAHLLTDADELVWLHG